MYWKFRLLEVWPPFLKNSRRSLATFKLFVLRHFDLIERSLVVGDDPILHHIAHAAYDLAFGSQHQGGCIGLLSIFAILSQKKVQIIWGVAESAG